MVNSLDILQFIIKIRRVFHLFYHLFQRLFLYIILCKFRYNRLHFPDVSGLFQITSKYAKLCLTIPRNLSQHKTFPHIIKNFSLVSTGLLKNTMCKSSKTQHIYIHNSFSRACHHKIFLCLHGKLFRHKHNIIGLGMLQRCFCYFFI